MPVECCSAQERATLQANYEAARDLRIAILAQHDASMQETNELAGLLADAQQDENTALFNLNACDADPCPPMGPESVDPDQETFTDPQALADAKTNLEARRALLAEIRERRKSVA